MKYFIYYSKFQTIVNKFKILTQTLLEIIFIPQKKVCPGQSFSSSTTAIYAQNQEHKLDKVCAEVTPSKVISPPKVYTNTQRLHLGWGRPNPALNWRENCQ